MESTVGERPQGKGYRYGEGRAKQSGGVMGTLPERVHPGVALPRGTSGRHTASATLPALGSQTSHLPPD
eukprot:3315627-Pleurochrysis_carterae.AAC.2